MILGSSSQRLWSEVHLFSPQNRATLQRCLQTTSIDCKSTPRFTQRPGGVSIMKSFALELDSET